MADNPGSHGKRVLLSWIGMNWSRGEAGPRLLL